MLRKRLILCATALAGLALAVAPAPGAGPAPASVALPPELARVLRDYEKAWRARDAAALARLFAEDGFVLSSGTGPVRGRAAIEKHYAGAGGDLALRAFAFAAEGRVGYILGGYAWDAAATDKGKFTLTLVRADDGRWLIFSDMDNGSSHNPR
jgi:ketosteroid isomerase-like protein